MELLHKLKQQGFDWQAEFSHFQFTEKTTHSYGIGEDWLKLRDRGMTADWQVYPTTPWNYAIAAAQQIKVVSKAPADPEKGPFTRMGTPLELEVKARRLSQWLSQNNVADSVQQSPVETSEPEQTLKMIPYAAAKLRITSFPVLAAGAANGPLPGGSEERSA